MENLNSKPYLENIKQQLFDILSQVSPTGAQIQVSQQPHPPTHLPPLSHNTIHSLLNPPTNPPTHPYRPANRGRARRPTTRPCLLPPKRWRKKGTRTRGGMEEGGKNTLRS